MKRVIKAAYGYEWDGTPVRVKDWAKDYVLKKDWEIEYPLDSDLWTEETLIEGGFITQEQYDAYCDGDYDAIPDSVTIKKGTHLNYQGLDSIGGHSTATYSLPEYNNITIRVLFDGWREELAELVSAPMSDEEKQARSEARERNKRNKELGLDKNGNPIMWGINNYSQTAVFNSPQNGIYNIGVIQSRGVVNSRQVGFKSEQSAVDFLEKLQPNSKYKLYVYKMQGAAVARHNWTEVSTKYGKAWITDTAKKSLPESSKEIRTLKAKLTRLKNKAKDEISDYILSLFADEDKTAIANRLASLYNIDRVSVNLYTNTESCKVFGCISSLGTTKDQEAELISNIRDCFVHKLVNVEPDYFSDGELWRVVFELEYDIEQAKSKRLDILEKYGIPELESNINGSTSITAGKSFYFGMEQSAEFGDLIQEKLGGQTVSKRKDLGEQPGGLVYEANKLGIDMWDLLEALEGMCHEGRAQEIDDSTYRVKPKSDVNASTSPASTDDDKYQMCWWAKYLPAIDNLHEIYFEYCGREEVEFVGTLAECQRKLAIIEEQQAEEFGDEYPERYIRRSKGQPNMKAIYIPKSVTEDPDEAHQIMIDLIPEPWVKCKFLGSIQKYRAENEGAKLLDSEIVSSASVFSSTTIDGWEFSSIEKSSAAGYQYFVTASKKNVGRYRAHIGGVDFGSADMDQLVNLKMQVTPIKPYDDANYHWIRFEGGAAKVVLSPKVVETIRTDIYEYECETVQSTVESLLCDIFDTLTEYNQSIKPIMVHN